MFQEDIGLVHQIAREIAKEEIAKAIKELIPKPVEVDIDEIVKLVLDKIKLSAPVVAAEAPKKGK